MAHPRTDIRNALETLLSADLTLSGAGWTFAKSQATPVLFRDLPKGFIYTATDTLEETMDAGPIAGSKRSERRRVTAQVHLVAAGAAGSTAQDSLDAAQVRIDELIFAAPLLGVEAVGYAESVSANSSLHDLGEKVLSGLTLEYAFVYFWDIP